MKRTHPTENTPRIVAITIGLWAGSVALAGFEGVFAKFSPAELKGLGLFLTGFAVAAYGWDRGVRAFVESARTPTLIALAIAADLLLVVSAAALAVTPGAWDANIAGFPYALSAFLLAPLAVVVHIAAIAAIARLSSAAARSPGAKPAAT